MDLFAELPAHQSKRAQQPQSRGLKIQALMENLRKVHGLEGQNQFRTPEGQIIIARDRVFEPGLPKEQGWKRVYVKLFPKGEIDDERLQGFLEIAEHPEKRALVVMKIWRRVPTPSEQRSGVQTFNSQLPLLFAGLLYAKEKGFHFYVTHPVHHVWREPRLSREIAEVLYKRSPMMISRSSHSEIDEVDGKEELGLPQIPAEKAHDKSQRGLVFTTLFKIKPFSKEK